MFEHLLYFLRYPFQLVVLLPDLVFVLLEFIVYVSKVQVVLLHLHTARLLLFADQVSQFLLVLLDVVLKLLVE